MNHRLLPILAAALLTSSPAMAAQRPDLALSLAPPSGVHVYESGHYTFTVSNVGNKNAGGVSLTIQLPTTNTSPTVYIMGTLGAYDSRCSVSGTALSCALGTIDHGASTTVSFDITLPYSAAPLVFDATTATTTVPGETNLSNNVVHHVASPLTYNVSMSPPDAAINEHCTGQGLHSYFECLLSPGSISSHDTVFNADGTISFPAEPPNYTGSWDQPAADQLHFQYFDSSVLVADFFGKGVSAACFEGVTTFPGSSYMSMYRVCLQ